MDNAAMLGLVTRIEQGGGAVYLSDGDRIVFIGVPSNLQDLVNGCRDTALFVLRQTVRTRRWVNLLRRAG